MPNVYGAHALKSSSSSSSCSSSTLRVGWLRFCGQLSGRFVVPEGPDDRSQAIYCLEYAEKRRTVPEGRCESGYTTYSPPMVEKRPVDRIIPFPTGRVLCVAHSRQSIAWLRSFRPSGTKTLNTCPQIRRQITPRGRIRGRRRGQPARRSLWFVGFKLRWLAKSGGRSAL